MVDADKGYVILQQIAVPVDFLDMLAKHAINIDYDYKDNEYRYRPKGDGIDSCKLISGAALVANQIAHRLEKANKK
jgi:hypothetical protein